jgi:hypothetical protein
MGIFVGTKTEIAKFKATGTKLAKGAVMSISKIGNQTPNGASGIASKIKGAVSGASRANLVTSLAIAQAKANVKQAQQIKPTGVTAVDKITNFIKQNPVTSAAIGGAALLGAGAIGYAVGKSKAKKSTKKKTSKKKKTTSRSSSRRRTTSRAARSRRRKRGYGTEAQYKRKGGLDVKYTKNGQPYVIKSDGRARFIKRSR